MPHHQRAVRVAASAAAGPLSAVRKKFNSLVKKLEAERARLALWQDALPGLRSLVDGDYDAATRRLHASQRRMVLLLDQAWSDKIMSKKEREKLADVVCALALELMDTDQADEQLKAIYNKHSGGDFDLEMQGEQVFLREMLGMMSGVELDEDTDVRSPRAIFEAMQAKMAEGERDAGLARERGGHAKPAKSAKLSAREARHQAEELKLKQSMRDIFRKLASALHPDRETDPAERERKTALMQRANAAYAANDLLGLLELQLKIERIDQAGLDNLGDDRIKQYNRILDGQIGEIKIEIMAIETALALDMGWEFGEHRTPQEMMRSVRADIADLSAGVDAIESDLAAFSDVKKLKAWLKGYRIPARDPGDEQWL